MNILALNAGSSSVKAALYALENLRSSAKPPPPLWRARADWDHLPGEAEVRIQAAGAESSRQHVEISSPGKIFEPLLNALGSGSAGPLRRYEEVDAVGHRMVHGGGVFRDSTRLTPQGRSELAKLRDLAPAHNQLELEGVEAVERMMGTDLAQVAVFDTAFHATLPPAAHVYPGPYAWLELGIRKYGFHGISHQYVVGRASAIVGQDLRSLRLISCHLGNGCSLAAVKGGRSVDTTMGFTTLDGLMMGTRSGSVDPGILTYLLRHRGYSVDQIDHALNRESGLLGISGATADMRQILAAVAKGDARAQLAFDVYVHRLRFYVAAMLPSLGGLDALIFTAGVGENCPQVRSAVCDGLRFLGLALDEAKNALPSVEGDISTATSSVRILVIRTQEEWEIARECHRVVTADRAARPTEKKRYGR